jgi:hypothetical protein
MEDEQFISMPDEEASVATPAVSATTTTTTTTSKPKEKEKRLSVADKTTTASQLSHYDKVGSHNLHINNLHIANLHIANA